MTEDQGSSFPVGTVTVADPVQAALVTSRLELRRLAPFMRSECTVSQAAEALGLKVPATFKLVQRYLKLGLLHETRREKRAGRAIRYYRAPGAFFVPFSLRPFEQIGEENRAVQLRHFEQNLSRALHEWTGLGWGTLTSFTASGETYYEITSSTGEVFDILAPESPRILSGWNRLVLSQQEAQEIRRNLLNVILPYLDREGSSETDQLETYQLGVFMAPDSA